MEKYFVNSFTDVFVGLFIRDYDMVVNGYTAVGSITEDIDTGAFKNDVRSFTEHYMNASLASLSTVSIGSLFNDLINVAVRNNMRIPAPMLFVSKALVAVEGTTKKVDPTFDIVTHSTKFAQTLIVKKKFEPKKLVADAVSFVSGVSGLMQTLPKQLQKIISMTEKQKLGMQISLIGSADFDRYILCISLSLISAGLSVGSSLVIQAKIAPMVWGVSFLGIFGYTMAVILGMWVVFVASKKNR